MQRRQFLSASLATVGTALAAESLFAQTRKRLPLAVNQYTCSTFYQRENVDFWTRLGEIKNTGIDGFEASLGSAAETADIGKRLTDHGLTMYSIYAGGNLHDENTAEKEISRLLGIGEKAKTFGTVIMVYNPAAKKGKTDAELIRQSKNINILGAGLKKIGITLTFHYHTSELEFGGREFYHIMNAVDPANLSLCFEQHWSYRACGNSQVAMFDHWQLYADRSPIVHLRQSIANVWSETFGDGDIDNIRLANGCKKLPKMPYLILEQAPETGTPKTLSTAEALRQSADYIRRVFG